MRTLIICFVLLLGGCSFGPFGISAEEMMEIGAFAFSKALPSISKPPQPPAIEEPDTFGPANQANERTSETPANDRARGRERSNRGKNKDG